MSEEPGSFKGRGDALLFLAYLGVAVGSTWPLIIHLSSHLPGHTLDAYLHYWNGWWVRHAVTRGQSPFFTFHLFYPDGVSLVYHNFGWIQIVGWLGLLPLLGGIVSYNVVFLLNLALCGWAAFLLVSDLTGDRRAAFVAGLIYQCWPFRMSQLDHPNLISTYAIPLFLLFLLRMFRDGGWRAGVLSGSFFALIGYTRWQLLIPAAIIGSIVLVFTLPKVWDDRRRWYRPLLLACGVAALALTPPALLFTTQGRGTSTELLNAVDEARLQTDVMAYLTPSPEHPVLGTFTSRAYERYYGDRSKGRRFAPYLGATTLLLAILGAARAPRDRAQWLVMGGVMMSLALGLDLRVNGHLYPAVPMPYRLAGRSFVVRLIRFPDRFSLFTALPLAVLAAHGAQCLMKRVDRRGEGFPAAVVSLLALAIMFEYLVVPAPLKEAQPSALCAALAAEPGVFGVLNLPIDSQACKRYMFDQTCHQQAILQGHVSRAPENTYAYLDSHPMLKKLRQFDEMNPRLKDVSRQLAALAADDVRYVVLQKEDVTPDRMARWRRYLMANPRFEDENIAVLSTSPRIGQDVDLIRALAPGIGPVRIISSAECLSPAGVMELDVGWGTTEPQGRKMRAELTLVSGTGAVAKTLIQDVSAGWPTDEWPANALAWGYYPIDLDASVPPATYEIHLALIDQETKERQGPTIVAGRVTVSDTRCTIPLPSKATVVDAVFGNSLRLLGHQLRRDEDRLLITLYWRSEQRMETDYKVFVHVFDRATDAVVAQDDAMPRRWRYPTTLWEPGQRVEDEIPVDIDDLASGKYRVGVGVYDPETMVRLAVAGTETCISQDGRLVLPGETVIIGEER